MSGSDDLLLKDGFDFEGQVAQEFVVGAFHFFGGGHGVRFVAVVFQCGGGQEGGILHDVVVALVGGANHGRGGGLIADGAEGRSGGGGDMFVRGAFHELRQGTHGLFLFSDAQGAAGFHLDHGIVGVQILDVLVGSLLREKRGGYEKGDCNQQACTERCFHSVSGPGDGRPVKCKMFDLPLHPAVVHLPIAFALFAPLVGLGALLVSRKSGQAVDRKIWAVVLAWQFFQAALIYAAMATGEIDEDRLGALARDSVDTTKLQRAGIEPNILQHVEEHEEAASTLLVGTIASFFLAALALKFKHDTGRLALRVLTVFVQILLLGWCAYTAHLGGKLVYEHGAANVHRISE